jgi:hypothetical protein
MRYVFALMMVLAVSGTGPVNAGDDHALLLPDALTWKPLPREWFIGTLPANVQIKGQVAIIHGDPDKPGVPFVIRLKSPGNSVLPVHWHEFDENITVLSGVWCVGTGDTINPKACQDMPAGSFIFMPKQMHHWAVTKDNIVEVHGIGPFRAHLVQ